MKSAASTNVSVLKNATNGATANPCNSASVSAAKHHNNPKIIHTNPHTSLIYQFDNKYFKMVG